MHCKCTIKLAPGANGMLSCNLEILTLLPAILLDLQVWYMGHSTIKKMCFFFVFVDFICRDIRRHDIAAAQVVN